MLQSPFVHSRKSPIPAHSTAPSGLEGREAVKLPFVWLLIPPLSPASSGKQQPGLNCDLLQSSQKVTARTFTAREPQKPAQRMPFFALHTFKSIMAHQVLGLITGISKKSKILSFTSRTAFHTLHKSRLSKLLVLGTSSSESC